jgi:hypothetical protein
MDPMWWYPLESNGVKLQAVARTEWRKCSVGERRRKETARTIS